MINNNHQFGLGDFYTSHPIEQYTDKLANQTSFCVHFHNAYNMAQHCELAQINEIKCKYCRAFYFPQTNDKKNNNPSQQYKKPCLKKIIDNVEQVKTYACELCGSINDIKGQNFLKIFPKFPQLKHQQKSYRYSSNFQSIILKQSKHQESASKIKLKSLNKQNQNELIFMFCIDLDMLTQNLQLSTLTYLKTAVKEHFTRFIENSTNQNHQQQQQTSYEYHTNKKQNYLILLTFNINEKLFVADLNTMSTICIDSLLKQKIISGIPGDKNMQQQIAQKQNERKQNLIELLYRSSVKINTKQSINRFQDYMDMLIQERQQQSPTKSRLSVQGSTNFTKLMQLLSFDKSPCNSYILSWISATPIINYEPHRIKKSNIYSLVYLFCQQQKIDNKPKQRSKNSIESQMKFQHSNVRNQLLLIKENNQVRFINVSQQEENTQFYYLLYEFFSITDSPKIFRPKWSIKTDAKYPPILTNDPPTFFIKNPTMLYFLVSSLIDKGGHNKFQLSVQYQDWSKKQHVWILNWTKDSQKQSRQLKGNSHKQIQLIPKMPQIYNYFHILVKFIINVAIRGRNDISQGNKKQIMSLNTVTGSQVCMIIESMINHGVFRANNIEIGVDYLSKLYEYLNQMKKIPFQVLNFFSTCQYNIRSAVQMIFPLILYSHQQNNWLIYWSSGYAIFDQHQENDDDENNYNQWPQTCMSTINQQYENSYYTKQFFLHHLQHDDFHQNSYYNLITRYYAKSAGIFQSYQTSQNYQETQSLNPKQRQHAINYNSLTQNITVYYNPQQAQYDDDQYN